MRSGHWWLGVMFAAVTALVQGCVITTGPGCGTRGEACCGGTTCSDGTCVSGTCMVTSSCGGFGEVCCSGAVCSAGSCIGGVCQNPTGTCGSAGAACCSGSVCTDGSTCVSGVCMSAAACGAVGEPCCAGGSCSAGVCSGGVCTGTASGSPYALCTAVGTDCGGGTTCEPANHAPAGGTAGAFCTASCSVAAPACPADLDGSPLICVPDEGATTGQCYQQCGAGNMCKPGFTCVMSASGGPAYCAPGGGSTATANAYDPCSSGQACTGGTTCAAANRTASGFTGFFCTAPCDISAPACPMDPMGTNPVVCVPDNATTTQGQCYLGCNPGNCNAGQTCSMDLGSAGPDYCVP